ncbi:hypothetical protein B0J11DRAFT_563038 [Dendryphion nanum]|uniref:Uncharacterized protein n=1 Tax=Dendryphion nanum TaxID=256645 RepID=A0A9P9IZM2_9PLEO|nr:hypothetical protein B0J11DRAFT_563038 [Dendryphion nanum]
MPSRLLQRLKSCSSFDRCIIPSFQCRPYTSHIPIGKDLGPIEQHEHQTFRIRKKGKPLPLPPVLDPVVIEAKGRYAQKKAKPNPATFTPFQKKLLENPYAHTLASPIRVCRTLSILLPSALLTTLNPHPHPSTSEPWLLPVNLTTPSTRLGPTYRFLAWKPVAKYLHARQRWRSNLPERLTAKLSSSTAKLVWREDMADLIESLMQKNVAEQLKWHFKHSGSRMVGVGSLRAEEIKDIDDVSCILSLRNLKTTADTLQAQSTKIVSICDDYARQTRSLLSPILDPHKGNNPFPPPQWYKAPVVPQLHPRLRYPPLEFSTAEWRGRRVAVYGLVELLGAERVKEVLAGTRFEGVDWVVVRGSRHHVSLEMMLLRLQMYLAVPGP